jgi:hypothetical protein
MNKTIGQAYDDILEAVSEYHAASMGDDSNEIALAEKEYQRVISEYGTKAVSTVVYYYNTEVIGKA